MLAVVSMALVSCGGGGVKLADPAVTYDHYWDDADISVKINSFDVKTSDDDKNINVSAKIELTDKGLFVNSFDLYARVELLDENEKVVVKSGEMGKEIKNIGEVAPLSWEINPEEGHTASKTLEKVKYIRFTDVYGYQ